MFEFKEQMTSCVGDTVSLKRENPRVEVVSPRQLLSNCGEQEPAMFVFDSQQSDECRITTFNSLFRLNNIYTYPHHCQLYYRI